MAVTACSRDVKRKSMWVPGTFRISAFGSSRRFIISATPDLNIYCLFLPQPCYFFAAGLAFLHLPSQAGVHVLPSAESSAFAVALIKSAANTRGSLN